MEGCCTVFEAIFKWYQDVEKQVREIVKNPSKIGEVVSLQIDDITLSKSDLDDITYELEGLYYDFESPTVDEFENDDVYCCKKIQFDRFFDETFAYEDGSLVISTGFKFEYWRRDGDESDLYEINEETYENDGKELEDENAGYYQDLRSFGWDAESDIK